VTLARLALAYARGRPFATVLVVLLLALGIGVVTLTLLVSRELASRLTRDAQGVDLVVGAKGSPLQLVLAGVYHVDVPPGNIPHRAVEALRANPLVATAIPLSLGDSFRGYRIVGTEPALIDHYGARFAQGRTWELPMEAVLGSEVARATGVGAGGTFAGSHGLADGGGEHAEAYRVTGVLAPTGTVVDRLVLTPLESVWNVHAAHHPGANIREEDHDRDHDHAAEAVPQTRTARPETGKDRTQRSVGKVDAPQPVSDTREVTLVLVRYASPVAAASLPRAINHDSALVAASPAQETARLLTVFGVGLDVLRAFALMLVVASALMLFVALAQALDERRYDIAILRTLGAHRWQIAYVLLVEALTLVAVGTALGLVLAHGAIALVGAVVPSLAPLQAAAWHFAPDEWAVIGLALGIGILAGSWPSWRAAHLDVAATLADN
jgi:putative ABC transport system permease protein